MKLTLSDLSAASQIVHAVLPPTPQYRWPLLCERTGVELWVKHENHTPVGSFKVRGGLVYFDELAKLPAKPKGVITATRGNHGQSVGFAAQRYGIPATVVVPHGNSAEKNAAMRAFGIKLIEHGEDFQSAREHAAHLAIEQSLHFVPPFHPLLVAGVATYCLELLQSIADLDAVFVPIGLGSGACAMVAARDALGLSTEIIGVVSTHSPAYAQSFAAHKLISVASQTKLADGMACRTPDPSALEIIFKGVSRIVEVTDDEVAAAMRTLFECTHNVAEGAGATSFAALLKEQSKWAGQRVAVIMSGGNVDSAVFASVLNGPGK
ncbi:MAG: threonine dehydratase [Acidobacteria bacterium]|nr:threonine dehydratase [Acidobacteriota bacterium]